jgi:hypothetical protein
MGAAGLVLGWPVHHLSILSQHAPDGYAAILIEFTIQIRAEITELM